MYQQQAAATASATARRSPYYSPMRIMNGPRTTARIQQQQQVQLHSTISEDNYFDHASTDDDNKESSEKPKNVPYASISSIPIKEEEPEQPDVTHTVTATAETAAAMVSPALQRLYDTVLELKIQYDDDDDDDEHAPAIAIWQEDDIADHYDSEMTGRIMPVINSLVFSVVVSTENDTSASSSYVLAVVDARDRVDETRLEETLQMHLKSDDHHEKILGVTFAESVQEICGFSPGCIPPIGLSPDPFLTVVDEKLVAQDNDSSTNQLMLQAGGGLPDQSLILPLEILLRQPHIHVANITRSRAEGTAMMTDVMGQEVGKLLEHPKPFFAVEPPDDLVVNRILERGVADEENTLEDVRVSIVGTIAGVRRMARELAFCDLVPIDRYSRNGLDLHLWRSASTGEDMAVQLIAGKTLCETTKGDEAIRRLQVGQSVLIQGRTNVQNLDSLRNWITKRSLDIVVQSYQVLQIQDDIMARTAEEEMVQRQIERRRLFAAPATTVDPDKCLKMDDLYGPEEEAINGDRSQSTRITIIDNLQAVKAFTKDLSGVLTSIRKARAGSKNATAVGLVGLDCEWKPVFLLPSSRDPQPVLLLQICLHSLQKIYLFDLQTLLRPIMPVSQSMDKVEKEVSFALGALFESKLLIKTGFQVVHDLRQLAASYPHISSLQFYNCVVESSTLGKKAIRMAKLGESRESTSSLSRLVHRFLGKELNKQDQCSDWSKRPLSDEQIQYASLDAAVTPVIMDQLVLDMGAAFVGDKPQLRRYENDASFKKTITSWRFVFIDTSDPLTQKKLKARRVVGDALVVSQSWTTGEVPPKLPAVMEGEDGVYRDVTGTVQVPSLLVSIQSNKLCSTISSLVGERVGKSKDKCVAPFLPASFPEDARLDYPQRTGFIEFQDGLALFVNMPTSLKRYHTTRPFPNEWLEDGQILTWFLRESDWMEGQTGLAKKILDSNTIVSLFVRLGSNGMYLCCGRCRVVTVPETENKGEDKNNWTLVKLYLTLLDWKQLLGKEDFQSVVNPNGVLSNDPDDDSLSAG